MKHIETPSYCRHVLSGRGTSCQVGPQKLKNGFDLQYVFPGHSVASDESFTNTNHVGLHSQEVLREIMGHLGDVIWTHASHFSDILSSLQFSAPSFITLCLNGLPKKRLRLHQQFAVYM